MKKVKKILRLLILTSLGVVAFIAFTNYHIIHKSKRYIHSDTGQLYDQGTALVLGTSKRLRGGRPNPFFERRLDAAAELYEKKVVQRIILSGDNESVYYNEPRDMLEALVKRKVPEQVVQMDFAGLRTLDSIIRAQQVFGIERLVIVTQGFHAYRAIFIARHFGIEAEAYLAKDAPSYSNIRVWAREVLARSRAWLDIYLLRSQPKFANEVPEKVRG